MDTVIYTARVTGIEKNKTSREGVFNQCIKVTPERSITNDGERRAYAPSFMPFTETGGGVTSIPQAGALCLVMRRKHSDFDQIITYLPHESVGPEGIYNPEEPDNNAVVLKVGGEIKSALTLAPGGVISLYSHPAAFFKLNGTTRTIDANIDNRTFTYPTGFENTTYQLAHATTGGAKVAEYKFLFTKVGGKKLIGDFDLETETVNIGGSSTKYADKVIIRAGTIYNYAADISTNKFKTDVGHVYQIETRQNSLSTNVKDTINIFRYGYQAKDNMKYTADTKYPAGTMIEWASKRVKSTPTMTSDSYSSYLMRYGKLEADVVGEEAEKTKGEIYRLQMYNDVIDPIGNIVDDPLGKGKGWKYEKVNLKAAEQFTESFGLLEDNSFYRKHIHAYPALTRATLGTYTGSDYTLTLGGDTDKCEEMIVYNGGKRKFASVGIYKEGVYIFSNKQYDRGVEETSESITIEKDNFEINVKVDKKLFYNIKLAAGKMTIKLDTGEGDTTTSIELNKEGTIVVNPGSEIKEKKIYLGGAAYGQQLVTKTWLEQVFANHIHPTTGPGAPTLPPTPVIPIVSTGSATDHVTFITKVE